ncbi:ZM domain-containing protein [Caenorhabditis elegans]|uniref:ZM domain-containing protein n=2 Tax=Caenorhabditis elegans TaxID=6239 RepID=Q9XVW8_CAEEL|nr:ZM domain-containing protein [Caenorhabditis elegans]CAA91340.2 ZM domain-containing protein [Caenorhabditis elegans]|eukprot:NP_001022199.1 Uncharacterized protein CELE_F54D5.15 [Caenorhabditis elegans]
MAHRSAPFISNKFPPAQSSAPNPSRMFCVSYASTQQSANTPTIHEQQEEIYSSLKKVRTTDDLTSSQLSIDKHVTMIPLGSPHELHREITASGTLIRVSSGLPQKMDMGANEKMKELVPKMRPEATLQSFQPVRQEAPQKKVEIQEPKKEFESWSGRAMEGRVSGGQVRGTNNMRGYWERNIQIEQRQRAEDERRQRPKSYGFPKWRSTDALSASLVASNSIQIPVDSRIPVERLRKMEETEREAIEVKKEIHEEAEMTAGVSNTRKLSKGKSLDSLSMQVDYQPWYDTEKIKSAVSRESIANIATSREFFETASTRDWRSGANSRRDSMCSLSIAPPLPPKSDAMQLRQATVNHASRPPTNYHQNGGYGQQYEPNLSSVPISSGAQNINMLTISSGYDDGRQMVQKQQQPQTSINRLVQQDSPQTADPIEQQEVLLMLYLKQNLDIVRGLGIHIPHDLLAEMDDLQILPVELRICDEEPQRGQMFSPVNKNGRYQRKPQPNMAPNRQVMGQMMGQKYGSRKDIPISTRSRQNSEMSNSNVDLSYHHHQPHSHMTTNSSYGYH